MYFKPGNIEGQLYNGAVTKPRGCPRLDGVTKTGRRMKQSLLRLALPSPIYDNLLLVSFEMIC